VCGLRGNLHTRMCEALLRRGGAFQCMRFLPLSHAVHSCDSEFAAVVRRPAVDACTSWSEVAARLWGAPRPLPVLDWRRQVYGSPDWDPVSHAAAAVRGWRGCAGGVAAQARVGEGGAGRGGPSALPWRVHRRVLSRLLQHSRQQGGLGARGVRVLAVPAGGACGTENDGVCMCVIVCVCACAPVCLRGCEGAPARRHPPARPLSRPCPPPPPRALHHCRILWTKRTTHIWARSWPPGQTLTRLGRAFGRARCRLQRLPWPPRVPGPAAA
jgi:hypothetical protein